VRGVAFEYRHKRHDAQWQSRWDQAIVFGSLLPAVLWGVAFANIVVGVPIDADMEFTGGLLTLLNPFGLLGGLVTLTLFITHGATFIALKTVGDIRLRARALAWKSGLVAAVLAVVFLGWMQARTGSVASGVVFVVAALLLVVGVAAAYVGREGISFAGTFGAIAFAVAGMFVALFPDVMPSSTDLAFSLTTANASATPYTLTIMTWVAAIFTPLVLGYQTWTYWVFRKRIGTHHIPTAELAAR
jgi:cytochrome d ubiquinol oxidase subunit II